MKEVWKDVIGYEGFYKVSSLGRIKSFARNKEMIIKPYINKIGYAYMTLAKDGDRKQARIHRVVAIAFLKNRSNKNFVNHLDGNKSNNILSNLEWSTEKENSMHASRTGLLKSRKGKKNNKENYPRKITDEGIEHIRRLNRDGLCSMIEISKIFGVSSSYISSIINNKSRI